MSFTTGSLLHHESLRLAVLYLEVGNWNSIRARVIEENLLQTRTLNSLQRVCREIISRLKTLRPNELEFLVKASHQEQAYLLWLAVCRRYRFIADFAVEVIHERYVTLKQNLTHEDYDSFLIRKSEWNLELGKIAPTTRYKSRQVVFRMLREANLLTTNYAINGVVFRPRLLELLSQGNGNDFFYFPVDVYDLKDIKRWPQTQLR